MPGSKPFLGPKLWMTGQIFVTLGIIGSLIAGSVSHELGAEQALWSRISIGSLSILMVTGMAILWIFGWKFYLRSYQRLNITRGFLYLAIVIAMSCLAPLIFIIIEGRKSFFDEAFS